jgi:hypothetical protein
MTQAISPTHKDNPEPELNLRRPVLYRRHHHRQRQVCPLKIEMKNRGGDLVLEGKA